MQQWFIKYGGLLAVFISVIILALMLALSSSTDDRISDDKMEIADKIDMIMTTQAALQEQLTALSTALTNFQKEYQENRKDVVKNLHGFNSNIGITNEFRIAHQEDTKTMLQRLYTIEEQLKVNSEFRHIHQADLREVRQDLKTLANTISEIERMLPDSHRHRQD